MHTKQEGEYIENCAAGVQYIICVRPESRGAEPLAHQLRLGAQRTGNGAEALNSTCALGIT